jgi:hypothetical protein
MEIIIHYVIRLCDEFVVQEDQMNVLWEKYTNKL